MRPALDFLGTKENTVQHVRIGMPADECLFPKIRVGEFQRNLIKVVNFLLEPICGRDESSARSYR